jgi:superfamily I DNA/RNA helicase
VGDDDQSIYGWRGAEISNLLEMEQYYPEVKTIKLEQNYRSTGNILQAANAVIKHNVQRRGKNLWSQKGAGAKITMECFDDEEDEARSVVEQIQYARLGARFLGRTKPYYFAPTFRLARWKWRYVMGASVIMW